MKILRGYKTELKLNNKQKTECLKAAGIARFAYNWGLRIKIDEYKNSGKSLNSIELHRRLNQLKKTDFPWMYEVSKCAPQEALRDLDKAFQNFFRRVKNGEKPGFPKFKSKNKGIGSFRLTGSIRIEEKQIQLPRLGWLRLKESGYLPINKNILSATISEQSGRWFVSVCVEEEKEIPVMTKVDVLGVDVGIKSLAVTSEGQYFENPKALQKYEEKLKMFHSRISRKKKGSNNQKKAVKNLAKLHYRIRNIRRDATHKASNSITRSSPVICIESLNPSGMIKNPKLAKSLSDANFGEFLSQIKYKATLRGGTVIEADRFFPSTKTCSQCGRVKSEVTLSEIIYECEHCGLIIDRDLNAAINLKKYTASSVGINACGDDKVAEALPQWSSMKQEADTG